MYKTKLWDEDKWDIHSSSYSSAKYGGAGRAFSDKNKNETGIYHEQKYGAGGGISSDYIRNDANKEREEKAADILEHFEEKKEIQAKEGQREETPKLKASNQLPNEAKDVKEHQPAFSSIEDAIKKAIEVEKKMFKKEV